VYRKIDTRLWTSSTIRALPEDARFLYYYLLTAPHSNILCCYRLPFAYMADDLQWDNDRVKAAFNILVSTPCSDGVGHLVEHCVKTELVTVSGQLEKEGLQNQSMVAGAIKVALTLPNNSSVFNRIIRAIMTIQKTSEKIDCKRLIEILSCKCGDSLNTVSTPCITRTRVGDSIQYPVSSNQYPVISDSDSDSVETPLQQIGNYEGYLKLREDQQFDIGILPIDGQAAILLDMFKAIYSERNKDEYPVGTWDRRNLMMMIKDNGFKAVEHFIQEYFDLDTKHTIKEFSSNISDGFQMIKKRVGVSPERMFG
jgi:hypothetical protein